MTIDEGFVEAEAGDVERGVTYLLVLSLECGAVIAGREARMHVLHIPRHGVVEANPVAAPVVAGQQACAPR